MKKLSIFVILLVFGCKPKDGVVPLLIGSWSDIDTPSYEVSFLKNGVIETNDTGFGTFGGGWCNSAKKYTLKSNVMYLEFSEPRCIPFIDPKLPSEVKIVSISNDKLVVERIGLHTFIRK